MSFYWTDPETGRTRVSEDYPPAIDWWDTPELRAEYDRVRKNYAVFGADVGKSIEECNAHSRRYSLAPESMPHPDDACRTCGGTGYLREEGVLHDCHSCHGSKCKTTFMV